MNPSNETILDRLVTLAELIDLWRPWAVCRMCNGTGKDCGNCATSGWMSQQEHFEYVNTSGDRDDLPEPANQE
jgi:hypothetical protein